MPLLLVAEGEGWKLEIVGNLPERAPFIQTLPESSISGSGAWSVKICDRKTENLIVCQPGEVIEPLFFETVTYDLYLDKDIGVTIDLPPGAQKKRILENSEHHTLNLANNVGFFEIRIDSKAGPSIIRLEAFARKVDYRTDYVEMRNEISSVLLNLAMAANAKTFSLAAPDKKAKPTLVEWFAIVEEHFEELIKLTVAVSKKPHTSLIRKPVKKDTERARRITRPTLARALRKNNNGPLLPGLGVSLPRKIDEDITAFTFDTPENRYYKGLLKATYRKMRSLSRVEETEDEDADHKSERKFFDAIRPRLKNMERRIEAALRAPFLAGVGEETLARPFSMVFHKHPIYSRVDKMARLFNNGLSFTGDNVKIGVKDTAVLYEYWCFLKMVTVLEEWFDIEEQTIVKTSRFKTAVTLTKGVEAAIKFSHKTSKRKMLLIYNKVFQRMPTINQKPDNVIQLASEDRFYIFDAKYRLQFDKGYIKQFGGVGPTTDDINAMHRYRDAIVIPSPLKKGVVQGAIVLFPFPDEDKYKSHRFYKSIDDVDIGGLPFLPQATSLFSKKLDELLSAEFPEIRETAAISGDLAPE